MPHMARASLESSRISIAILSLSSLATMRSASTCLSSPLGPLTLTSWPFTAAVTPPGTDTGFLPMRDIVQPSPELAALENITEDFAADILGPGARIRHHALRRRQDGHAKTVGDGRQILDRGIDAPSRRRHSLDILDHGLAVEIFELDLELGPAAAIVDAGIAADIALLGQHIEHALSELGGRRRHLGLVPQLRVADAGQHIA